MKSGSLSSFQSAAPNEVYPGEPSDPCEHGWPDSCPYCELDRLKTDYQYLEEDCSVAEDRVDNLAVMLDALITEHMNQEYNSIEICDVEDLIDGLYQQGRDYLEKVRKLKGEDK